MPGRLQRDGGPSDARKKKENSILINVTLIVLEMYWNMFLLSDAFQFPGCKLPFQKEY